MIRYLKLWYLFAKFAVVREMEFKANFSAQVFVAIAWTLVTVFGLEIIFFQADSIAGWSKGEVYLIYAMFRFASSVYTMLFRRSIHRLALFVNSGEFDFYLTKPINTLFLTSTRHFFPNRVAQVFVNIGLFAYAFNLINLQLTIPAALLIIFLTLIGVIIRYNISMILSIPVFWLEKLENIYHLEFAFFGPARYPLAAFPTAIKFLLSFVIPVLFVAAIPAQVVLGKSPPSLIIGILAMAATLSFITHKFFNFALRHYSSASS